ncbi:DNA-3-methyladenine glycosylase [Nocardioides jiangxiensis]|uniref:Putative 3-methyladenine DNA glycosylase n=1 Tax=Nocardioides jiangxiensis TaxID=3064524 RepID=A0ABT9B4K2_9ACTN|nr:DNA-3-methyladenine glycosylase [Nocardioides sp. WY-20]MDO7869662.1 DNA-3-methyladenine glycosylase [Nocardioides sp. WY-20]
MPGSADLSVLERPVLEAAPLLLGAVLRHDGVAVRITEVEAYAGEADPASHAGRGMTPRSAVMFGPAGHLYVYLAYGANFCANVVTGPEGEASAVLLRAGEVIEGLELAQARRGTSVKRELARGPGRLCSALGIRLRDNRTDLRVGPVTLELGVPVDPALVSTGPRVGVSKAADVPWRFWLTGDPTVSAYRSGAKG